MEDRKAAPGASTPLGDRAEDSDSPDAPDVTLGGYLEVHERPPAFTGSDEQPYTASVEVESVENLAAPYVALFGLSTMGRSGPRHRGAPGDTRAVGEGGVGTRFET